MRYSTSCRCVTVGIVVAVLLTILFAILISSFQKIIPNNLQNKVSFSVIGSGTIPLEQVQNQWIKSVDLQWNFGEGGVCSGEVAVITGRSCRDLHSFQEYTAYEVVPKYFALPIPVLALPGSSLIVSVPDSIDAQNNRVWITQTLENFHTLTFEYLESCEDINIECKDSCYLTNDFINESIVVNVSSPGFYYYFLTNDQDLCPIYKFSGGIRYFVNITTISNQSTRTYYEEHSIHSEQIFGNRKPKTVQVSRYLKFAEPVCPLLTYQCDYLSDEIHSLQLISWKPRTDILTIIGIVYFAFICLDIIFIFIIFCYRKHSLQ